MIKNVLRAFVFCSSEVSDDGYIQRSVFDRVTQEKAAMFYSFLAVHFLKECKV